MTAEQKRKFLSLTLLQQNFLRNIIAGMTRRDAYFKAGGTAKNDATARACACEMLSNPNVKPLLEELKLQNFNEAIMSREEALSILSDLGRGNLTDIVKFRTVTIGKDMETGEDVNQTVWEIDESLQEHEPERLRIISELNGPKIKVHSKTAAIAQLARMMGWEAAQKSEITVTRSASDLSDDELAALAASDDNEG